MLCDTINDRTEENRKKVDHVNFVLVLFWFLIAIRKHKPTGSNFLIFIISGTYVKDVGVIDGFEVEQCNKGF